jgi:hypothetical protein
VAFTRRSARAGSPAPELQRQIRTGSAHCRGQSFGLAAAAIDQGDLGRAGLGQGKGNRAADAAGADLQHASSGDRDPIPG